MTEAKTHYKLSDTDKIASLKIILKNTEESIRLLSKMVHEDINMIRHELIIKRKGKK